MQESEEGRPQVVPMSDEMITVAARHGGSLDGNAKLRLVVDKARVLSMPKDAIERAINKSDPLPVAKEGSYVRDLELSFKPKEGR